MDKTASSEKKSRQPSAAVPVKILRWRLGAKPKRDADAVAREEPLEIRVRGRSVAVTMRTPGNDRELAAGFLLTEGVVRNRRDIVEIAPCLGADEPENTLNVFLAPAVKLDFKQLTRHVFASSSCGLCGKASIEAVHRHFPPIEAKIQKSSQSLRAKPNPGLRSPQEPPFAKGLPKILPLPFRRGEGRGEGSPSLAGHSTPSAVVAAPVLAGLPEKMRAAQATFAQTGGLHAAAIFNLDGDLLVLREDVGRHNAVDKVLGWAFLKNKVPLESAILLVSGRASFEIMQKALAGRVPIVCAISAPSSLAVEFARESAQTLVGFLRGNTMNVYSSPERILTGG